MAKEPGTRKVFVGDQQKGELFRRNGLWWWRRPSGAVESYRRGATMNEIMDHIGRICGGAPSDARKHNDDKQFRDAFFSRQDDPNEKLTGLQDRMQSGFGNFKE